MDTPLRSTCTFVTPALRYIDTSKARVRVQLCSNDWQSTTRTAYLWDEVDAVHEWSSSSTTAYHYLSFAVTHQMKRVVHE